jgi:hypothetical protein
MGSDSSSNNEERLNEPKTPSTIPQMPDLSNTGSDSTQTREIADPMDNLVGSTPSGIKSWNEPQTENKTSSENENNNDIHNQISKSKLDTIEAKVTLIDARIYSMEQKIELMFQMISSEVSEETRRKLKVDSMMKNIKE